MSIGQTLQQRRSDVISQVELLRMKLDVESKINKAKTLEIELLTRHKKGKLYSYMYIPYMVMFYSY